MRRKKHFRYSLFAIAIFMNAFLLTVSAQDSTRHIRIEEAVALALNNNRTLHLAQLDEQIAAANYKQTEAIYLPQIQLSYNAMSTNNPLNAFGFKLQERSITQNDFNPDLLNHPAGTPDFMGQLSIQQPLVNIDLLYMRKSAAKQTEVYQYKTQRTKEYLTFEVQKAFLQLQLTYQLVKVLEEALQTAQSVYTFTDNHFKQGLVQKSDVLNAQVQVSKVQSSLTKTKSAIQNVSDYLGNLLGQKMGITYQVDEMAPAAPSHNGMDTITTTRADFMAIQKAIEASDLMINSNKMSYLPKLNAFANYQLNDSRMLGFGANAYLAGVQLSWDIFKGNKTKNVIATQIVERNKLSEQLLQQKDQSRVELQKANRDLADAQAEIKQHKVAIEQAAESLRILQNRYQQGLVNTTDILMAVSQLSEQRFSLAQAEFAGNVTKAYLEFLIISTNK